MYFLHVPADLPGTGRLVAVFTDAKTNRTEVIPVKAGTRVSTSGSPQLAFVTESTTVYLQRRQEGVERQVVSPRARIGWLQELNSMSGAELAQSAAEIDEHRMAKIETSLAMASWVSSPHSEKVLAQLGTEYASAKSNDSVTDPVFKVSTKDLDSSLLQQLTSFMADDSFDPPIFLVESGDSTFSSVAHFLREFQPASGQFRVADNSVPIDFHIDALIGVPLVVVLHGRRGPEVQLPYLSGAGIVEGLHVSRLAISDPSLYLDDAVTIGWHAGNAAQPVFQRKMVKLVSGIAQKLKAPRVIFFGGSAGGFASLVFAHLIPGSVAIVWNPETDITKYYPQFVDTYVTQAWTDHQALKESGVITSAVDLYQNSPAADSHVLYLQQASDLHHVDQHLKPFVQSVAGNRQVHFSVQNWGEGHIPPPRAVLQDMLRLAIHPDFEQIVQERIDFWTS